MLCIFAESDQTCQGSDQRTCTADIDAEKQFSVIVRKLRKQNGAGYVTDDLTGKRAYEKRILFEKPSEKALYEGDPCHITREHEKRAECKQKRIIDLFQSVAVKEYERERNQNKTDLIGDHAKDDDNGKREKRKVDDRAGAVDPDIIVFDSQRLGFDENETAKRDDRDGNRKRQRHNAHKFACGDIELGIYVKVLRIAERSQHTAEIGGNILHNEGERHIFLLLCRLQNHKSKRQKREKRHIVSEEHRPDEGDVYQGEDAKPCVFAKLDDASCERNEKTNIAKGTNTSKRTEQTGQSLEVKITEILGIGRNHEGRDKCRRQSNRKNGIPTQKITDGNRRRMKEYAQRNPLLSRFFRVQENVL